MGYNKRGKDEELEENSEKGKDREKEQMGKEEEDERKEKGEEGDEEEKHRVRVIVKGYMRPDGTSYYVVIPKEIRELFGLKGGEYFLIRPKLGKGKIELKLAKFVEE
jgi:AbrB family looped-hinge helix DNA binding protein